jgi:hypothetical protein
MTGTLESKCAEPGDFVETSGRHVGDQGRKGEIVAVLGEDERLHYVVRWHDGHETILYPGEGTTIRPHDAATGWAD